MRIYGLTGGTGSGKSEVARRFVELGIPVIDADQAGHDVIEPGGPGVRAIVEAFGDLVLTNGAVDRGKLAALVFADKTALAKLNAIVHPLIGQVIAERCSEWAAKGHDVVVLDAALLAENGKREPWLHGLILVTANRDLRFSRLVTLRAMDPDEARRRIEAQTPPETKIPAADWIIENEGTLEALRARTDEIAAVIKTK